MLLLPPALLPLEIILQSIFNQYLNTSYCVTIIQDRQSIDTKLFPLNFMLVSLNSSQNLQDHILAATEMGCSDYIVQISNPKIFFIAFEQVNHLATARKSDRNIVILPLPEHTKEELENLLNYNMVEYLTNFLIILPAESTGKCDIYTFVTNTFVGEYSKLPLFLDRWNSCKEEFEQRAILLSRDLTDLKGKNLTVAAFTYTPYILLDLDENIASSGRDGVEIRIVEEFCKWINCTIQIVRDDVFEWGEIYDNGTGVGILGNVFEDRADIGITALYSWYDVYRVLDFSSSTVRTAITCITPAPRVLGSWDLPLSPFSWIMWTLIIITFLFAALALFLAQQFSSDKVFLTSFGMMVTQSQNDSGGNWRVRSITGWLLITGLILDNAYSSGLAASFTVPTFEKPIDTVQDMVDNRLQWGATHDAWVFSLILSQEPKIKQLVSLFRVSGTEELKQKSFTRELALSIEKLPAGHFAIGDYITKEAVQKMQVMMEDFYYEQCVVIARKSSPYIKKMNKLIGRLHQSGLMLAWETQVALKYLDYELQLQVKLSRSRRGAEFEGLNMSQFVGIFGILIIGAVFSTTIFVVEILSKRQKI